MVDDLTGFGKIAQSIEQVTKEVRQLSYDFLDPPVKEAGQWIAERIRFYRVSSAISTLTKARQKLESAGLPVKSVDLKTFLPLMQCRLGLPLFVLCLLGSYPAKTRSRQRGGGDALFIPRTVRSAYPYRAVEYVNEYD